MGTVPNGSSGTSGTSGTSGASGTSGTSGTSGGTDAGPDAEPDPIPAKLQLVNAVTDLGPVTTNLSGALRICYQIPTPSGKIFTPGLPPLPNRKAGTQPFPGLFLGTGGPVQTTGADLSTLEVTPYIISAQKLESLQLGSQVTAGNDKLCGDLFGTDAGVELTLNTDYWVLPPIAAGELAQKNSYLLVLTGCTGDSTVTADLCGAGHTPGGAPGNGNLKITKLQLDNTTVVDAASVGAQFAHASPNASQFLTSAVGSGVRPAFTTTADPPVVKPLTDPVADVAYQTITPFRQIAGVEFGPTGRFTANVAAAPLAASFGAIETLSFGTTTGTAYGNGKAYTFIALGDPNAPPTVGGNFNFRSAHYLGLPNDPVITKFDKTK